MILLIMVGFVVLIDVLGWRKLAFPLVVVGMNSIFIYSAGFLIKGSIDNWISAFSGGFKFIGTLAPVAEACSVMVVLWYLCFWLYQRRGESEEDDSEPTKLPRALPGRCENHRRFAYQSRKFPYRARPGAEKPGPFASP